MGLGYIARVAHEMSFYFFNVRDSLRQNAVELGEPQRVVLNYEGIEFGALTALPDGSFDTSELRHVSPDLVVRPFGHKGRFATLEELSDEALQIHHGHQTPSRLATYEDDPLTFLGPGSVYDPDNDGIERETRDGQPMLLATYMSLLPIPQLRPPQDPALLAPWGRGRALLREVGCVECHREELRFFNYETTLRMPGPDPFEFTLNLLQAGLEPKPRRFDVTPLPDGSIQGGVPIFAYTDLRRHDMGPGLADTSDEVLPDGADVVPASVWLTRSLWGLADTAPYLHDGRAPTVHDAILWHGGEAQEARDRYEALPEQDRAALRLFLASLTREPTMLVE
jgi:cytochrome c peroxidase